MLMAVACSLVRGKDYTPSINGILLERQTINREFCGLTESFREWNKQYGDDKE